MLDCNRYERNGYERNEKKGRNLEKAKNFWETFEEMEEEVEIDVPKINESSGEMQISRESGQ